jgi:hypothetical protein
MSGLAGLPDLSDEDWLAYQGDAFRKDVRPILEASQFRASIQPLLSTAFQSIQQEAETMLPEPPVRPAQPVPSEWDELGQPLATDTGTDWDGGLGDMGQVVVQDGAFSPGLQGPSMGMASPAPPSPSGPDGLQPGPWSGTAPEKPGLFSWAGEQMGRLTDEARRSGFSQTPVVGPMVTGAGEALEGTLHSLGGSAEAMRRGGPGGLGMGLAGVASTALNTLGDIPRGMATEAHWPEHVDISPFVHPAFQGAARAITPETPVVGGLTNPRELVGLGVDLAVPETFAERQAGRLIGRAAKPALEAAGEALAPVGRALQGMTEAPSGMTLSRGQTAFHGSGMPFDTVDPAKFSDDGLFGPGYYTTTNPDVAASYADELRGVGQPDIDWGVNEARDAYRHTLGFAGRLRQQSPDPESFEHYIADALEQKLPRVDEYRSPSGVTIPTATMPDGSVTDIRELRDYTRLLDNVWDEAIDASPDRFWRGTNEPTRSSTAAFTSFRTELEEMFGPKGPQSNIRKVNVPAGTRFFDVHSPVPGEELDIIREWMQRTQSPDTVNDFNRTVSRKRGQRITSANYTDMQKPGFNDYLGQDYYYTLNDMFGGKKEANRILSEMGFDGVMHEGGRIMPMRNAAGQPITHQVYVVFPDKLNKVNNAISGAPGGIVSGANTGGRYYHGTVDTFDRARVPENGGRSYALPGYYATPDPEVAGRYAGIDETGAQVRPFDLDPDTNLFDARRKIPEAEIRQIVAEMQRIAPEKVTNPERLVSVAMAKQSPPWNGTAIGALFALRGADTGLGDTTNVVVSALKALGYHGVRADEAGEIISLFDTGIAKARNALSGRYGGIIAGEGEQSGLGGLASRAMSSPFFSPARTGEEAAFDVAAGTAGGVAGAATAEEDATWQERLGRGLATGAVAAGLGPMARAPGGLGGLARGLAGDEVGGIDLGAISRGRLNPPEGVSPEQWRGMSRNERRRANYERRRGEYAGRAPRAGSEGIPDYTTGAEEVATRADAPTVAGDNAYDEVYERQRDQGYGEQEADETAYAAGRARELEVGEEVARQAEQVYDDYPSTYPDDSPTQKQTADEAVAELTEGIQPVMPYNPVTKERQERFVAGQEGLQQPGVAGAMRQIAEQTGSTPAGSQMQDTLEQLNMFDMDELLDPDMELPRLSSAAKAQIERGAQIGSQDAPEVQEFVQRLTRAFQSGLERAHGRGGDAAVQEAATQLERYALDIARTAEPGTGTSAALVALMNRAVEATDAPAKMAYDRWRYALKSGADLDQLAALEANAKRLLTINTIYRAGQEVYSSEAGRSLRANRADVFGGKPFIPRVAGAAVDSGDAARRDLVGSTPPRLKAGERLEAIWAARQKALRAGDAEPVSGGNASWDDIYWQEVRNALSAIGPSGRKQSGALEREGYLWQDLFLRDDAAMEGTSIKLTENERMRWMYGLEEVGIGTAGFDEFWDRMADIDPSNRAQVLQFWNDAAKAGGSTTYPVKVMETGRGGRQVKRTQKVEQQMSPFERGLEEADKARALPNRIAQDWEGYLDAAETMTRDEAITLAERELKNRLSNAEKALEEATRKGDRGGIKRYEQAAATARKDLNDGNGLLARIERSYPPQIVGQSSRLRSRANELAWRAEGKTGDEQAELMRQAGESVEGIGPAWRRQQYRPGFPQGFYDDPVAVVQKAQLLQQLDEVTRTARIARGALSVVTSNMLTSARMVEASVMESALMMGNRVYQQLVTQGDAKGAAQLARGMWAGATPAWANFVQTLRTGMGPMEALDFLQDVAKNQAPAIRSDSLRGKVGLLAPMHRISRGIQEFFTTIAYYGELSRLASVESTRRAAGPTTAKTARSAVRTPGAMQMTTLEMDTRTLPQADIAPSTFFYNPTEEMRKLALQEAAKIASGGPHSAVSQWIANTKSLLETGKFGEGGRLVGASANVLFPFVYGIDFSIRSGLKTLAGPVVYGAKTATALARRDLPAARANATHFGLTLGVDLFLFDQIRQGNITGKGPSDPDQRQALMEAVDEQGDPVWRPDSMRVPLPNGKHLWMNYTSLPVVGVTGAIMANMWDAWVWDGKKDKTPPERFATLAANTAQSIAEGTFFRDSLDLASILTQPQSASTALSRFAGGLLGRAVPAVVRQAAYAADPNRKAPDSLLAEVAQGIPGARNLVPNQVSPYTGGDVGLGYSWATPFAPGTVYYGQGEQNPVASESLRLQRQGLPVAPSSYSATQQGRGATVFDQRQTGGVVRGIQSELAEETGPRAAAYINSPQYQALSDQDKAAALEELFGGSRRNAEFAMKSVPGVQLSPEQRLDLVQSGVPRYYGVRGTPEEIDHQNREIGQAKAALAEYTRLYGPDRGELMLRRISPQAWRLAVMREEIDPDLLWMRQRRAGREAGFDPSLLQQPAPPAAGALGASPLGMQFVTPDYTPPALPPPQTSFANRLPPSARR